MQPILARLGAVLLGALLLLLSLVISLGTALLVPLAMFVAWRVARRRRRAPTNLETWMSSVIPFGVAVMIGFAIAAITHPHTWFEVMEKAVVASQQQPPEQPAFLRQLGAPPPVPLPPAAAKTFAVIGGVGSIEFLCALVGTMAWGGTSLLVLGARGRTAPPVAETASYTSSL